MVQKSLCKRSVVLIKIKYENKTKNIEQLKNLIFKRKENFLLHKVVNNKRIVVG